ncbi:putative reverse transcriptase domain-containing protein [Tanacetum coccineum]
MIKAIDQQLFERRLMRNLEKFVEYQSDTKVFTMTMEILPEPTSNKLRNLGIGDGAHTEDGIGMEVEIAASDIREDEEEFKAELDAGGTMEIAVDPLVIDGISESTRGDVLDLEDTLYDIFHYMSEVPLDRITEFETAQRQLEASQLMASRERERAGLTDRIRRLGLENLKDMTIIRSRMTPEAIEELIAYDNGNGGNRNGNHRDGGNNGNGNPNENGRGAMQVARVCTYQDFMKFQPLNFKGTAGVVVGVDAAFAMTWTDLMKLMMEVYCPRNEIQKMETELWNLTMKNNDLAAYTQRFQELTLLCTRMVSEEEDRIERYVGGLTDNIQGNVMSAKPTRLQDAIRLANSLMDQKLKGYAIRSAENKRKFESNQRDNRAQQPPFKRQNIRGSNVARAYMAGGNEVPVTVNQRALVVNQRIATCFECGRQGHFKKDCPKLKNQNHGKKPVIPEARGKTFTIGGGDANQGFNVVTGTFLLNNHYAFVLFDSGADQSFMSTTFSTLLDVIPDTLDVSYVAELADERIVETNIVLRGCTIGLLGHSFNIDLMPIELGSFDVIIGNRSDKGKKSMLSIISCTKIQKYMEKGCQVFLAQVTKKETKVKSKEKRLEDVPIIRKIPEVFPEDLHGLPPT